MSKGSYLDLIDTLDQDSRTGEVLPILTYTISIAEVFMFSAITWNRHRIHYDKDRAIKEGHEGVLVQRGFIGNILCRYINEIFIDPKIEKLHWKVLNSTLAGSTLTASGIISKSIRTVDGMKLQLMLVLSNDLKVQVCQGSAEVHQSIQHDIRLFPIIPYKN